MRLSKQMKYESVIRDRLGFVACLRLGFLGPSEEFFFHAAASDRDKIWTCLAGLHVRRDRTGHFGSRM